MPRPSLLACAIAALVAANGDALAHDFWVQPRAFRVDSAHAVSFMLQVGHGQYRQRSPIQAQRITRFQAVDTSGRTLDLRESLHPGGATDDGAFRLPDPGTYVLVLETDNRAESHLPSVRFNDYLTVEGLTPALERRQRERRMDVDETEIYSRHAKVIVRVGAGHGETNAAVTAASGMTLEIIPDVDPCALPRSRTLPVRVMYRGHALPGATVKLTDLDHDEAPVEILVTDDEGRASFAMPRSGQWLLNTIWTRALPTDAEADYETDFSSLAFGTL